MICTSRPLVIGATFLLVLAGDIVADITPRRPDIVVIMIDTLRADQLGCYGNTLGTSPTIDAIAAEGVRFSDAVATAPWTCPSVASVFTSLYPARHGVIDHEGRYTDDDDELVTDVLAENLETLAEGLRDAGYQTAAFVGNRWLQPVFGFSQGFETYDLVTVRKFYPPGRKINEEIAAWLPKRDANRPLFLYVHYMDVHGPYNAPAEYRRTFVEPLVDRLKRGELTPLPDHVRGLDPRRLIDVERSLFRYREYWIARYDAGVRYVDDHVASLRDTLTQTGIWKDATVVILADHGEELADHGGGGHGFSLHGHQLQIPLTFRAPWITTPGRIDATVSLVDVAPTLWDLAGADAPVGLDGRSLLPLIKGTELPRSEVAFAQAVKRMPNIVSAQIDGRKLIFDTTAGQWQYYDRRTDPTEHQPLATAPDDVAAQLRPALTKWVTQSQAAVQPAVPHAAIDPETARLLKSIGYLQDAEDVEADDE